MHSQSNENLAYIDDLTGFFNRRYLYSYLPVALQEAEGAGYKIWLFMLDVDGFKMINDTYGHLTGDQLLKELSRIIKDNTKAVDKRIRYAGDEFTVILPNVEEQIVKNIAQRLISKISEHRFKEPSSGRDIHITVSVGIAGFPTHAKTHLGLIKLADQALYVAKEKGKNCMAVVSDIDGEAFWKKNLMERFPAPVFINREKETNSFIYALDTLPQSGQRMLLIEGPSGIGKSRLLANFEKLAATSTISVNPGILSARLVEKMLHQPFHAIGQAVDSFLTNIEVLTPDALAGLTQQERDYLFNFIPGLSELIKAHPVNDIGHDEQAGQKELLSQALVKFIINISKDRRMCFIFDDMQYMDPDSLQVVTSMIQEKIRFPALIIGAFSNEELVIPQIGDSALKGLLETKASGGQFELLSLSGLDRAKTQEMVESIIEGLNMPDSFYDLLYNKTAGNPLFIEESIKYMVEKGFIYYSAGAWAYKDINEADLPGSIEKAIISRIEDLDEDTRNMIAKAAVIGEDFQVDLLQKIDSEDRGYVLDLVEAAKKIGLVYEKGVQGKDEFSFFTNKIRNVILDALGGAKERDLHSRLGKVTEKLNPDKINGIAGELYYHFKKAEDDLRAKQYAKIIDEGKGIFYDRTIDYAHSLLKDAVQDKMLVVLSKKAWQEIPAFIRNICIAVENYILYPAQNEMVQRSIKNLFEKMAVIFNEAGVLSIAVVGQSIIVNNRRIGKELSGLFVNTLVKFFKDVNIENASFAKEVSLEEVTLFIELLSKGSREGEETAAHLMREGKFTHIQIHETIYNLSSKRIHERDNLQEVMLIDYLLGKMPLATDPQGKITNHAQDIMQALDKIGDQVSAKTGRDKEEVKAQIMSESIQRMGKKFLGQDKNWPQYKESLAKTLLSMEPTLRANILSGPNVTQEANGPSAKPASFSAGVDIVKELSFKMPDDVITDTLIKQYANPQTDIRKFHETVKRLINSVEQKENLLPVIRGKLLNLGANQKECDWFLDPSLWAKTDPRDKLDTFLSWPGSKLKKILCLFDIALLVKQLLDSKSGDKVKILLDKIISLFNEKTLSESLFLSFVKDLLDILIDRSEIELLKDCFAAVNVNFKDNKKFIVEIIKPILDKLLKIAIDKKDAMLLEQVLSLLSEDKKTAKDAQKSIQPIAERFVQQLLERIDANKDWQDIQEPVMLLKDYTAGFLVNEALCEKGVPEGKYFEAYLRRHTIGKILASMPVDLVCRFLPAERFNDVHIAVVKNLIELVGAMDREEALDALVPALNHSDINIKRKAIFVLSKMRGLRSAQLIASCSSDESGHIRSQAIHVLQERPDSFAKQVLSELLKEQKP
ncbi:MAG: diguanylate cyclase [Candidatus Omnitrophica bacterium]|jgi:diguanylate cyclase (GGDEF)-like protein|nr:diguanylate cyclase [Candidatus Omnitrophota bacterium]